MGDVTVTINGSYQVGNRRLVDATVAFNASYSNPAGDTYTPVLFGLSAIDPATILVCGGGTQNGTKTVLHVPATPSFRLFTSAGTEAVNASNQSAVTFRVWALGYP